MTVGLLLCTALLLSFQLFPPSPVLTGGTQANACPPRTAHPNPPALSQPAAMDGWSAKRESIMLDIRHLALLRGECSTYSVLCKLKMEMKQHKAISLL